MVVDVVVVEIEDEVGMEGCGWRSVEMGVEEVLLFVVGNFFILYYVSECYVV